MQVLHQKPKNNVFSKWFNPLTSGKLVRKRSSGNPGRSIFEWNVDLMRKEGVTVSD